MRLAKRLSMNRAAVVVSCLLMTLVAIVIPAAAITLQQSDQRWRDTTWVESSDQNWIYSLSKKVRNFCCPDDTNVKQYGYLNWTTDGCSWAPDRTFYYDFRAACVAHDFSYRNWKKLESLRRTYNLPDPNVWNETKRQLVDDRFLANMRAKCSNQPTYYRSICRGTALTFYNVVRLNGD